MSHPEPELEGSREPVSERVVTPEQLRTWGLGAGRSRGSGGRASSQGSADELHVSSLRAALIPRWNSPPSAASISFPFYRSRVLPAHIVNSTVNKRDILQKNRSRRKIAVVILTATSQPLFFGCVPCTWAVVHTILLYKKKKRP